ncbi:MAG: GDSL-type esterase/lipase family protein, partial [Balneolaceae bacterium]
GGYNEEAQDLFIEAPNSNRFLVSNVKFIERYFPSFVPEIAPNAFRKIKQKNTFRVFVFGGSSTQGFPYNFYYSFSDQLEQRLLLNTEGVNVEVINLGMTAVNSYVIQDLSKKVLEYEPDAIIIYAGHNEYYGSFGAASTQFGFVNNVALKRFIIWLKNFRFYQVLESLMSSDNTDSGERRTMMAKVINDSNINLDGDIYNHGIKQYQTNLDDVLNRFSDNNIPVFIGTIASKLRNQEPLTENEEALNSYAEGDSLFAALDTVSALKKYIEARELDGIRFRAPNKINEVIREVATSNGAIVVDVENMIRSKSQSKIEDESLFIDHLHPNYIGHQLIADLFLEYILEIPRLKSRIISNEFNVPEAISTFENAHANVAIARLLVGYPFKKNISIDEELSAFDAIYESYKSTSYIDSAAAVASKTLQFVPEVLTEVINELQNRQDSVEAIAHYYELLKWQLNSIDLIEKGIEYAVNNRETDEYLVNLLLQTLNDGSYDPRYMDVLSSLYLLRGNTNNAEYWLKESERLDPSSPRMLYNYTRFHLLKGDTLKVQQYYQRFLESQNGN